MENSISASETGHVENSIIAWLVDLTMPTTSTSPYFPHQVILFYILTFDLSRHRLWYHPPLKPRVPNFCVLALCLRTVHNWSKVESMSRKNKTTNPFSIFTYNSWRKKFNLISQYVPHGKIMYAVKTRDNFSMWKACSNHFIGDSRSSLNHSYLCHLQNSRVRYSGHLSIQLNI